MGIPIIAATFYFCTGYKIYSLVTKAKALSIYLLNVLLQAAAQNVYHQIFVNAATGLCFSIPMVTSAVIFF
jgi:hypothetical protein